LFNYKKYVKPSLNEVEVREIKDIFDLFDKEGKGSVDPKGTLYIINIRID
jgi:Ca2+-binding EF-hand superfamily protein